MSQAPANALAVIADDEDSGRLLLEVAVNEAGLEALSFANGDEALRACLSHQPKLVLLDVDMPGMNGYDVCRALRIDPRFALTPIVMVTTHDDSDAIAHAFEAGATDFISKPVNWALLPRRLEYILRNAAAAEHIERLAYFDTLTGLPNRQRCIEAAKRMCAEGDKHAEQVAVIYIDMNGLKRVNDTFGHTMGDAVLTVFAARLVNTVMSAGLMPQQLTIARFGGDEFVVLLRHRGARQLAEKIAGDCCEHFKQPITHGALEFYSAPSVGYSIYPEDAREIDAVIKYADTAMYQARANSNDVAVAYSPAMSARMRDWLELEGRLRRAVHNDLLSVVYQPKFRLSDQKVVGVEALLRWRDAEYGDISPTRFVEIAEGSGLILDMTGWLVRTVCRQLRTWLDRGIRLPIAINCSGKELLHGDPARLLEVEAAAAGVPTSLIEVELTESQLIKDSAKVQNTLVRLRQLGCRIALDDFGTGYSSLAYITRFPPDRIKIDKAFVDDVDRSNSDAAIADAVLSLAKSLNLVVTAEGVERTEQLEWLRARGCHEVQGFLLSKPLSAAELEARFLA